MPATALPGALLALFALAAAAAPGCGDATSAPTTVLVAADDRPLPPVRLTVTSGAAVLGELDCPAAGERALGPVRCAGSRLSFTLGERLHLAIRSAGFELAHLELAPGDTPPATLLLVPVPTATPHSDYATGFTPDAAGAAAFAALAVTFPSDLGRAQVVKFYVDDLPGARGAPTVYFQNTREHPLHYDFYRDVLGQPGTRTAFELATYHGEARTAAAGTLLLYPDLVSPEVAPVVLTFFPSDDLSPALALRVASLIEARLGFTRRPAPVHPLAYLPAGDVQEQATAAAAATFAEVGASWLTHAALYGGLTQQLLNPGVAFGTLRRLTPEELAHTVVSFGDVLLLTRLPNDLPIVGGTLTEELQTPLAHVNVAARARGTPNLALRGASADPRVAPFIGQLVRLEVTATDWSLRAATLPEAQAFWASRQDRPPFTPGADLSVTGLLDFADLGFDDADAIGVKAANLAELHALLPELAPDGFAVPFSAYDAFMATSTFARAHCTNARADCLAEARSPAACDGAHALCRAAADAGEPLARYVDRLLADAAFNADTALRDAALDGLRWLIRHLPVAPDLAASLDAHVALRLGPTTRVRLRSSTNAEDLPEFSGAGLYDSFGADASGADAASLEIRKVWASVWNWRAFEERTFWNIDQRAVRMGVGVHPAYPDERCNGVLITRNLADPTVSGFYVNVQKGEVAVTNPDGGAIPEVLTLSEAPGGGIQAIRQRFSSLSPAAPLMSDAELADLFGAAWRILQHFSALYGASPYDLALDLEFKLHGPDRRLVIKQVRPYHAPNGAAP